MILDLSKLSPMCQREILIAAQNIAQQNSFIISNDLSYYSNGEVKKEMEGWRDAARKLVREIYAFRYPQKKK